MKRLSESRCVSATAGIVDVMDRRPWGVPVQGKPPRRHRRPYFISPGQDGLRKPGFGSFHGASPPFLGRVHFP